MSELNETHATAVSQGFQRASQRLEQLLRVGGDERGEHGEEQKRNLREEGDEKIAPESSGEGTAISMLETKLAQEQAKRRALEMRLQKVVARAMGLEEIQSNVSNGEAPFEGAGRCQLLTNRIHVLMRRLLNELNSHYVQSIEDINRRKAAMRVRLKMTQEIAELIKDKMALESAVENRRGGSANSHDNTGLSIFSGRELTECLRCVTVELQQKEALIAKHNVEMYNIRPRIRNRMSQIEGMVLRMEGEMPKISEEEERRWQEALEERDMIIDDADQPLITMCSSASTNLHPSGTLGKEGGKLEMERLATPRTHEQPAVQGIMAGEAEIEITSLRLQVSDLTRKCTALEVRLAEETKRKEEAEAARETMITHIEGGLLDIQRAEDSRWQLMVKERCDTQRDIESLLSAIRFKRERSTQSEYLRGKVEEEDATKETLAIPQD